MPLPAELRASLDSLGRGLLTVGSAVAPVVSAVAPVVSGVAASVGAAVSDSAERLIDETAQRLPRYSAAYLREQMANKQRLLTELSETCVQLGAFEAEHRSDRHLIADLEERFQRAAGELEAVRAERDTAVVEAEVLRDLLAADRRAHESELGRLRDSLAAQQNWHRERLLRSEETLHSWRGAVEGLRSQLLRLQAELGGVRTEAGQSEDEWSECVAAAQSVVEGVLAARALLGRGGGGGGLVEDLRVSLEEAELERVRAEELLRAELQTLLGGNDPGTHLTLSEMVGRIRQRMLADAALKESGLDHERENQSRQLLEASEELNRLREELRTALAGRHSEEQEKLRLLQRIGSLEAEYAELTAAMEEALVVEQRKDALLRHMKAEHDKATAEQPRIITASESREAVGSELQSSLSELERALAEVAAARAREEELRASLAESREAAGSELQSSRSELERALAEVAASRAREEELRASLAAATECREELSLEATALRDSLRKSLSKFEQLSSVHEKLIEEVREHESRHEDDAAAVEILRCRVIEIAADHEGETAFLNQRIVELQRAVQSLEIRNQDLGSELARLVGESRVAITLLEAEISDKESRLQTIEAEMSPPQRNGSARILNPSLRSDCTRQEAMMADLASITRLLVAGSSLLPQDIHGAMNPLGTFENGIVSQEEEIDLPLQDVEELLSAIRLTDEENSVEKSVLDMANGIRDLAALLSDVKGSLRGLLRQKRRSDSDCLRLRSRCRELEHRVSLLRAEVLDGEALRSDLASANQSLAEERERGRRLGVDLEVAEAVLEDLKSEHAALVLANSELDAEVAKLTSLSKDISKRLSDTECLLIEERQVSSSLRTMIESQALNQSVCEDQVNLTSARSDDEREVSEVQSLQPHEIEELNQDLANQLEEQRRALQVLRESHEQLVLVANDADRDNLMLKEALRQAQERVADRDGLLAESERRLAEWSVLAADLKREMTSSYEDREELLRLGRSESEQLRVEWTALSGEQDLGQHKAEPPPVRAEQRRLEEECSRQQAELDRLRAASAMLLRQLGVAAETANSRNEDSSALVDIESWSALETLPRIESLIDKLKARALPESWLIDAAKMSEVKEKLELSALKISKLELEHESLLSERNEMQQRTHELLQALNAQSDALAAAESMEALVLSRCEEAEARAAAAVNARLEFELKTATLVRQLRAANARLEDEVAALRKLVTLETSLADSGGDVALHVAHPELVKWLDGVISVSIDCQEALTVAIATDIHTNNDAMADSAAAKSTHERLSRGLGLRLRSLILASETMRRLHSELLAAPWRPGSEGGDAIIAAHEATALREIPVVVFDAALGRCARSTLSAVVGAFHSERRRDWDFS